MLIAGQQLTARLLDYPNLRTKTTHTSDALTQAPSEVNSRRYWVVSSANHPLHDLQKASSFFA